MTEEEAKTKWCKDRSLNINIAVISAAIRSSGDEIDRLNGESQNCIASACMKWESWEYEGTNDDGDKETKNKGCGDCGLKTKELECNRGF